MKASVSITVWSLVAGTTLAAAATVPFVERHVVGWDIQVVAKPPPGTTNYLVKEKPPFGEVGNISHGGVFDPATRTVVFGPFNDGQSRTLTYADAPPLGAEGRFVFSGEAVANGTSSAIVGDDYLEIPPFPALDVRLVIRWRPLTQQIAVQVQGGQPCFVLASTNLQDWVYVGDVNPVLGGFELVDTAASDYPHRFYRARTIPPPPVQPLGDWAYQGFDARGSLIVTGIVTFATATNPLAGGWDFKPARTPLLSGHYVGQETFDEGELTDQQVMVRRLRAIDNEFMLSGQMGGDDWVGTWSHSVEGPTETGTFVAQRIQP